MFVSSEILSKKTKSAGHWGYPAFWRFSDEYWGYSPVNIMEYYYHRHNLKET